MRDTIRVGTWAGINVGLHWSAAIIAVLFTLTLGTAILPATVAGYETATYLTVAAVTSVVFMASIIAHELGHSVVATNNGVSVAGITLFALGGVARLESDPPNPGAAARIALAGPAVSVAIGAGSLVGATVAGALGLPAVVVAAVTWLGIINLVLAVFNMVPALPLDGGRALQALLWKQSGNRHEATVRAAGLGRALGWAIVLFGLWQFVNGGGGLWTALIGWFVVTRARAEAGQAQAALEWERWKAAGGRVPVPGAWPFGPAAWPQAAPPSGFDGPDAPPTSPATSPPPAPGPGYHAGPGTQAGPGFPLPPPSGAGRPRRDVIDVDGRRTG